MILENDNGFECLTLEELAKLIHIQRSISDQYKQIQEIVVNYVDHKHSAEDSMSLIIDVLMQRLD